MKCVRICVALLLVLPTALSAAQGLTWAEFLKGERIKPTLKFTEADDSYKAVELTFGGSAGADSGRNGLANILNLSSMRGDTPSDLMFYSVVMLAASNLYWTKSEFVTLDGTSYLVAYKLEMEPRAAADSRETPFAASLKLTLIRTERLSTITPDPNRSIASLRQMLDAAKIPYDGALVASPEQKLAGNATAALSNIKQVSVGMLMYGADNDDLYPYVQTVKTIHALTAPYIKNDAIWKTSNPNGSQFLFNMCLAGTSMSDTPEPAGTPMFYESKPWPDGRRAVAFTDGHAKLLRQEEWDALQPMLHLKIKRIAKKPLPIGG